MAVARTPAGGPIAATPRAATPSRGSEESRCYANHNGSSAHDRRGAQRRLRAPQPLLEAMARTVATQITMAVAHTPAGAAALTMRFRTSENRCYANHNGSSAHDRRGAQRRLRAPQPLLEALERSVAMQITMAVAHTTAGRPSGDSARRSPCRSAHSRGGAQRRLPAPQPLLEALETAPATVESWGGPAATPRAAVPSRGSGDCTRHCGELGGPSGDSARRSPF